MTGRKNRALQVSPVVPYKAIGNFSKAWYGTTRDTCSARFFRHVMGVNLTLIESVQLTLFNNFQRRVKKTLAKESN